jgi:hypothetical protein
MRVTPCLYEQESLHLLLNTGEFKECIPEFGFKIEKNRIPIERPKDKIDKMLQARSRTGNIQVIAHSLSTGFSRNQHFNMKMMKFELRNVRADMFTQQLSWNF